HCGLRASCTAPLGKSKVSPCQWKTVIGEATPRNSGSSAAAGRGSKSDQPDSLNRVLYTRQPRAFANDCGPRQKPSTGIFRSIAFCIHVPSSAKNGNASVSSTFIGPPITTRPLY